MDEMGRMRELPVKEIKGKKFDVLIEKEREKEWRGKGERKTR